VFNVIPADHADLVFLVSLLNEAKVHHLMFPSPRMIPGPKASLLALSMLLGVFD
jgi:hypothetical protein